MKDLLLKIIQIKFGNRFYLSQLKLINVYFVKLRIYKEQCKFISNKFL